MGQSEREGGRVGRRERSRQKMEGREGKLERCILHLRQLVFMSCFTFIIANYSEIVFMAINGSIYIILK